MDDIKANAVILELSTQRDWALARCANLMAETAARCAQLDAEIAALKAKIAPDAPATADA
jgi:hypothetical protein